ncbi:hypothetical protein BMT54_02845 [Pasteurellaceae bacterium 15-036681]|nr:hypothetical protein BMT54_02845 [Pasteurellaceae bacterium 15-036681]
MHYQLDLRQYLCPLPLLMTKKAVKDLVAGDQLEILTNHSVSLRDFELMCEEQSLHLNLQANVADGYRILLQK